MTPRHLICAACRLRVLATAPEVALLDGRCPTCGATLTAAPSAQDVLGFRSFCLDELSQDARRPSDVPSGVAVEAAAARRAQMPLVITREQA
jgi:hypothetical protein